MSNLKKVGRKGWHPLDADEATPLDECPFCHSGDTMFLKSDGHAYLTLIHKPDKGVNCPARFEQICDSVEQGAKWWNDRSPKVSVVLPDSPDDDVKARSLKISKTPLVQPAKQRKLTPKEWKVKKLIDP